MVTETGSNKYTSFRAGIMDKYESNPLCPSQCIFRLKRHQTSRQDDCIQSEGNHKRDQVSAFSIGPNCVTCSCMQQFIMENNLKCRSVLFFYWCQSQTSGQNGYVWFEKFLTSPRHVYNRPFSVKCLYTLLSISLVHSRGLSHIYVQINMQISSFSHWDKVIS